MTVADDLIPAVCMCGEEILIHRTLPESVPEQDRDKVRVPTCIDCAKAQANEAPSGTVRVFHRKRVARHEPRITDGLDHEVTTTTKEGHVAQIDLSALSDAEIGAEVRRKLLTEAEAKAKAKRPKAKKVKRAREVLNAIEHKEARKALTDLEGLEAFTVDDLEVPALEVFALDEVAPTEVRSFYNKARWRLAKESGTLGKETTFAQLVDEHRRLKALAAAPKKPAKKGKAEVTAVEFDTEAKAKRKRMVEAVMDIHQMTKTEAKAFLAGKGL